MKDNSYNIRVGASENKIIKEYNRRGELFHLNMNEESCGEGNRSQLIVKELL